MKLAASDTVLATRRHIRLASAGTVDQATAPELVALEV
jgi:hypothetical protein